MLIGLVGAPSSGKSSFFSAATLIDVAIASYPFTTIEPNRGFSFVRVECAEKFFGVKCNPRTGFCRDGIRYVPVELMDVAGLVPDAHKGEGRGNEFLNDLSRADALIHIVDVSGSTNEKGELVGVGNHDPTKNILFLEDEIDFWFIGVLEKNWPKFSKIPVSGKTKMVELLVKHLSGIGVTEKHIDIALSAIFLDDKKFLDWTEDDRKSFAVKLRHISKPIIVAANKIDLKTGKENLEKLRKRFPERNIIGCSAQAELALKKAAKQGIIDYVQGGSAFAIKGNASEEQKKALDFIKASVLDVYGSTGVQDVLEKSVFDILKYVAIFPGGVKKLQDSEGRTLPDVFLLPPHSTALDFAFKIHSDFGNNFIRAIDVKTRKMIGKEHELKHCDVIEIIANA